MPHEDNNLGGALVLEFRKVPWQLSWLQFHVVKNKIILIATLYSKTEDLARNIYGYRIVIRKRYVLWFTIFKFTPVVISNSMEPGLNSKSSFFIKTQDVKVKIDQKNSSKSQGIFSLASWDLKSPTILLSCQQTWWWLLAKSQTIKKIQK